MANLCYYLLFSCFVADELADERRQWELSSSEVEFLLQDGSNVVVVSSQKSASSEVVSLGAITIGQHAKTYTDVAISGTTESVSK